MATKKALRPKCDFCGEPAIYDTQTLLGPWAHVCSKHFHIYSTQTPGLYTKLEYIPETEKVCTLCGEKLPIKEFYKFKDINGHERYRGECKACNLQERKVRRLRGW